MRQAAEIVFADDSQQTVVIDNRDLVAWDMVRPARKWAWASEAPFLFQSFIAYSACQRDGLFSGTFDDFQRSAVDVTVAEEIEDSGPYEAGSWSRLIVELAIATRTAPADWRNEPPEVIMTALAVLEEKAKRR